MIYILLCSSSCEKEHFTHDPFDPRLPVYSQDGSNSAGAFFNDQIWRTKFSFSGESRGTNLDIESDLQQNSLTFTLDGSYQDEKYPIQFVFNQISLSNFEEVATLEGKTLELNCPLDKIDFAFNSSDVECVNGQIFFHKIISVSEREKIVAGTFSFDIFWDDQFIEARHGRFDYTLVLGNFKLK